MPNRYIKRCSNSLAPGPQEVGTAEGPVSTAPDWVGPSGEEKSKPRGTCKVQKGKRRATENIAGGGTFGMAAQRRPGAPPAVYTVYK